jgi:hypothetical protein
MLTTVGPLLSLVLTLHLVMWTLKAGIPPCFFTANATSCCVAYHVFFVPSSGTKHVRVFRSLDESLNVFLAWVMFIRISCDLSMRNNHRASSGSQWTRVPRCLNSKASQPTVFIAAFQDRLTSAMLLAFRSAASTGRSTAFNTSPTIFSRISEGMHVK